MRSWVWSQHWRDVLFLHWRVPVQTVVSHLPPALTLDTRDGEAWVTLVLFRLRVRPTWMPFLPGVSNLIEVNLRTYVRYQGQPGIWFLSVHADNRLAMWAARQLTPLPYRHATMQYRHFPTHRRFLSWSDTAGGPMTDFSFLPIGGEQELAKETLDEWLLERYRLFALGRRGMLVEAEVAHPQWLAQPVDLLRIVNHVGYDCGLNLQRAPELAHFSPGVAAYFGKFHPLMPGVDRSTPASYLTESMACADVGFR